MKEYSQDLRRKITDAVERGMSQSEAARVFGVGLSTVKRYVRMKREGGSLAPKKRPGKRPKLDERGKRLLEADLEERPAATIKERCEFLEGLVGVKVSESTLSRMMKKMGWTRETGLWRRTSGTKS